MDAFKIVEWDLPTFEESFGVKFCVCMNVCVYVCVFPSVGVRVCLCVCVCVLSVWRPVLRSMAGLKTTSIVKCFVLVCIAQSGRAEVLSHCHSKAVSQLQCISFSDPLAPEDDESPQARFPLVVSSSYDGSVLLTNVVVRASI